MGAALLVGGHPAPVGAANVNCVASLNAVTQPGQSVCFPTDPTLGVSQVPADEQPTGSTTLIFSDDPEYVPGPGILYQDTVTPRAGPAPQPFRVYLYHVDPATARGPLYVGVVLTNSGTAPAAVTVTRWAVGGPSANYLALGKQTTGQWLASAPAPTTLTIDPGTSAFLDSGLPAAAQIEGRAVEPGQAINAIFDATTTAPVQVTVAADNVPIGSPSFMAGMRVLPSQHLAPGQSPMRGTFLQADEVGSYTLQAAGSGQLVLHVADAGRYLTGYDAVDRQTVVDYGNYGVLYHETLTVAAPPGGSATHFALVVIPRGGNFTTSANLTPGLFSIAPVAGAPVPSDNQFLPPLIFGSVLQAYCLLPGTTTTASLEWMPAAGSFLPVDLWAAPLSGGLAGLPGAAACAPDLAALAPSGGQAGSAVTLTGQGFGAQPGAVMLTGSGMGAVSLPPVAGGWSQSTVTVRLPASLSPGSVGLAVYSAATGLTSAPLSFLVLPPPLPPALSAASPLPLEPGAALRLSGSGFGAAGSVDFQQGAGPLFTVSGGAWSAGSVDTVVPAGLTPGTVALSVYDAATGLRSNALILPVAPPPAIAAPAPQSAQVGTPFALTLEASGGAPAYAWSLASGSLPPGVALDAASGQVAGLPAAVGSFAATIRVTDALGASATSPLLIAVAAPPAAPAPSLPPQGSAAPAPGSGPSSPSSPLPSSPFPAAGGGSAAPSAAPAGSSPSAAAGGAPSAATVAGTALAPSGEAALTATPGRLAAALAATPSGALYVRLRVSDRLPARARVTLPPGAMAELATRGRGLTLEFGSTSLSLPPSDLSPRRALATVRAGGAPASETLVVQVAVTPAPASESADRAATLAAGAPVGARVQVAAPVFSFGLFSQGHPAAAVPLPRPAVARLAFAPGFTTGSEFLACYRLGPRGVPAYVPSAVPPAGSATVACVVPSTGRYTVLSTRVAFADLTGSWAAGDVAVAAAHRVVDGVGPGVFAPAGVVTRAEFSAMLARSLGLPADAAAAHRFSDVPPHAWYAGVVGAVARAGLLQGIAPTVFDPLAPVTREQAAVVLARALPWVGRLSSRAAARFSDAAAIAPWARAGVAAAAAAGLVQGFPGGSFRPALVLDRAQAAAVFVRYLALGVPVA